MKVKIDFLPEFMRLVKPLWKKYASFEQDYMRLLDELRSGDEETVLCQWAAFLSIKPWKKSMEKQKT